MLESSNGLQRTQCTVQSFWRIGGGDKKHRGKLGAQQPTEAMTNMIAVAKYSTHISWPLRIVAPRTRDEVRFVADHVGTTSTAMITRSITVFTCGETTSKRRRVP